MTTFPKQKEGQVADIAFLLEGTYPYIRGGVSSWVHQIIRGLPELTFSIAFLGDTGAYFTGRALGRHKLYPALSPKKTWEGAVGGLASSAGAAAIAHFWYLPELPLIPGLILGAAAGAMGQAGDLCESMIKRAHGVKDSGTLLPGHGGMLDRIDALLFAAPVLYIGLLWLGFVSLGD